MLTGCGRAINMNPAKSNRKACMTMHDSDSRVHASSRTGVTGHSSDRMNDTVRRGVPEPRRATGAREVLKTGVI